MPAIRTGQQASELFMNGQNLSRVKARQRSCETCPHDFNTCAHQLAGVIGGQGSPTAVRSQNHYIANGAYLIFDGARSELVNDRRVSAVTLVAKYNKL